MIEPLNFLLESEQRYQGAVSGRFILHAVIGTAVALSAILAAQQTLLHLRYKSDIATLSARCEKLKPRIERIQQLQQRTVQLRKINAELDGWGDNRPEWSQILRQIQRATPPNIQYLQMEARDPLTAPRAGGGAVPKPRRTVRLRVSGLVVAPQADSVVSGFIQALRLVGPDTARVFSSVTLLTIQADPTAEQATSRFEMEAAGPERLLK